MKGSGETRLTGLIVLTLCFIWGNSLLPASLSGALSDWLGNLLAGIFGGTPPAAGRGLIRKLAHFTEYMALGAELWLLLRHGKRRDWSLPLLLGGAAALVDETIQLFVDGRSGALRDVWIDLGGFWAGCLLCWAVLTLRRRNHP